MGLDKVKKRFGRAIKNPPEVKEIITPTGAKVKLVIRRGLTIKELQEAQEQEYRDLGLNMDKLIKAGFHPDEDNPDDFCCEEYGDEEF